MGLEGGIPLRDPGLLARGVPRGSLLSPTLFSTYRKPLGEAVWSFGVRSHQYADDTQLGPSFPPKSEEAASTLDQGLV